MRVEINATLVVVAFKRFETLKKVLDGISDALVPEYREIIFVQQGNEPKVSDLIKNFKSLPSQHLYYDRSETKSSEQAINANVYAGISAAFQNPDTNLVTILEDDILVAKDFLRFNVEISGLHYLKPAFKGINGFSGIQRNSENQFTYSKQRFGLGWGWSITDKTWDEMKKFWLGTENFHWDGLVESFCKSGYVIMPSQSRVMNLGFDKDATHTSYSDEVKTIESRLQESYVGGYSDISNFIEVNERQNWRSDCLPYVGGKTIKARTLQKAYDLQALLRIKPGDSRFATKAKAKLLGMLQRVVIALY